jgi:hypothetical protein
LSSIHKELYAAGHCYQAVIHLPDPRMLPLPVQLGVWEMQGEREQQLRALAHADEPQAIEPPVVELFTTERLGTGLEALYHRQGSAGSTHDTYLNYGWRVEKYETDLRLFTFSWGALRVEQAMPDIDDVARALAVVK